MRLPHLEARFPGWRVEVLDCEKGEQFYPAARLVLVKAAFYWAEPDHVEAHICVHLEDHLDEMGRAWTAEQEAHANEGALVLLASGGLR